MPGDLLMSCAGGTVATAALDFDAIMAALGSDPAAATMSLQLKRQGRADVARHVIQRILNSRFSSETAPYDVVSDTCQAL